jgi:16S rRNA (guanine1516-N2)-methyltransferase
VIANSINTSKPHIDFLTGKIGYRSKHLTNELLAKAVGVKKNQILSVIDATAGLGRDGFILACLGCEVTMLERSPVVAESLQDALTRALSDAELAQKLSLKLINSDAKDYFLSLTAAQFPDVIYLDPMHPVRTKSALVKKDMRLLREIVGEDLDADMLLLIALNCAKRRVVVKRPRLALPLAERKPDIVMLGKHSRFDIYLTQTKT